MAIINLQNWTSKCHISINTLKTKYMLFYRKRRTASPTISLTFSGAPLKKVSYTAKSTRANHR